MSRAAVPGFARIKVDYDRLWQDAKLDLARGIIEPDPVAVDGCKR